MTAPREQEKDRLLATWREAPETYLDGGEAAGTRNAYALGVIRARVSRLRWDHGFCVAPECGMCRWMDRVDGLFDALDELSVR